MCIWRAGGLFQDLLWPTLTTCSQGCWICSPVRQHVMPPVLWDVTPSDNLSPHPQQHSRPSPAPPEGERNIYGFLLACFSSQFPHNEDWSLVCRAERRWKSFFACPSISAGVRLTSNSCLFMHPDSVIYGHICTRWKSDTHTCTANPLSVSFHYFIASYIPLF